MRLIQATELDKQRWDALVASSDADVFSFSWYLDACAHAWCVLVDADFKNGIALPFTVKMGVKAISPPIFVRNLDFIGNDLDFRTEAMKLIWKEFPVGHMQLTQEIPGIQKKRVFQVISEVNVLNEQARRMIRKAAKNGITVAGTTDWKSIFSIIRQELSEKISEFNDSNLQRLEQLIASLERQNKLCCLGIYQQNELVGGMVFMDSAPKRIYLKGASTKSARDLGSMYLCMDQVIRQTVADGKTFDFGGSEVQGVRRFNLNLGGTDRHYYIYSWNNAPWWFKLTKRIYQKWKKK